MAATSLIAIALLARASQAIYRTPTPPMGWNSYNYYSCYPNETIIKRNAQGLVDLGFDKLGYNIVTTDCGWVSKNRTADGQITWIPELFPSGFPALGDFIHSLKLQFGVYSDAGIWQCDVTGGTTHGQGSLGYEQQDADTFASWGFDALKYDNCWATADTFVNYSPTQADPAPRFAAMSSALDAVNRSVIYSICEWGAGYNLGQWAAANGDTWRISNDIQDNWASIWRIANEVVPYVKYTGPGKFADMDMLTIGLKVLSGEEEKFEMTLWAIEKSPLVIGAPMDTSITPQASLDILGNADVIAINQDALAEQAALVRRYTEEQYDIWAGNLTNGRKVVAVTNWSNDTNAVTVDLGSVLGLQSAGKITDVWAAAPLDASALKMDMTLTGHEAKLLVLEDLVYAAPMAAGTYYSATNAALTGDANLVSCNGACAPVGSKIQDLGYGATVSFSNVVAPDAASTRLLGVDFANYDIALPTGTNVRNLTLAVNGGTPKRWAYPISGGNWTESGRLNIEVDGFTQGSTNTLTFGTADDEYGPDFVGVEVF